MRIYFKLLSSDEGLGFEHQHLLTGCIHKWLGENKEHGIVSLYSFSQLSGGRLKANKLYFENGASFYFSSYKKDLIMQVVKNAQQNPEMFNGLRVSEIIIQDDPDLSQRDVFYNASPIFIKRKQVDNIVHILYDNPLANDYLKETMQTKMNLVGIVDETFDIRFDLRYKRAGTKNISYKGIKNRANWCPVIIKGKPATKVFAWNVGVGNSTGIGFGAIK